MALLWRERNLFLCAAEKQEAYDDRYIPDDLHYRLAQSGAIYTQNGGASWHWTDLRGEADP